MFLIVCLPHSLACDVCYTTSATLSALALPVLMRHLLTRQQVLPQCLYARPHRAVLLRGQLHFACLVVVLILLVVIW